ncbi:MAG: hypothetical protein IKR22_01105 [Clostridiales bacterium]|nr:hypothetical protein [Clostridiales bacterium]
MGFLDNFKQAMEAAKEAANNNIERQRAEKAAAEAAQKPQTQARPQPARTQSRLPEDVVQANLMQMDPIPLGTNSNGQNVMVSISGVIRAKAMGVSSLDSNAQRVEIKNIVRETLTRELAPNINSMGDLKFLMLTANRLNPVVIEAIKARGYEAAFTMPLMIRPVQ